MNLFPGLTRMLADSGDDLERLDREVWVPNHGPQSLRTISAGRQASKIRRRKAAERRKMNARHRRQWMENRLSVAVLRGQLGALDRYFDIEYEGPVMGNAAYHGIRSDLEYKFGSVDAAYDRYNTILAEQAA